jgi:hypothetical protein
VAEEQQAMNRYKVDTYDLSSRPFALYVRKSRWGRWRIVQSYETERECKEHYALIKHLPVMLP